MKQTAVDKLLEYFIKEQKEGRSHWCIHDLIAQLYVAKEMEREQMCKFASDYVETQCNASFDGSVSVDITTEEYYNLTFKSE